MGSSISLESPPQASRSSSVEKRSRSPPLNAGNREASAACGWEAAKVIRALSGCVRRAGRRSKLRGDFAMEDRRSDMVEAALEIGPDLAADIGPALAER